MPFNTLSVACATTPTVISTLFSHFLNPSPLVDTPFSHLPYHEGVALVRRFLVYASHHTVEQLQAFTAQYVPHPTWVHTEDEAVPDECISHAAAHLIATLGPDTLKKVGGQKWWQWRTRPLVGEWIEMRSDYHHRRKHPEERPKTMMYIHGGAYFFGSVDEHRYQMQRHARKLNARVFAPRYRLAPQFPFPCAIHDALACYLHLLQIQDASTIIFAGDSAGGGLILSLLTILRDQGLPLPAGAVLISPWVDLCHSFPSVTGDNSKDYIPSHGFLHRPSAAWPPPTREELTALSMSSRPQTSVPPIDLESIPTVPIDVPPPSGPKNVATTIDPSTLAITIDGVTIPLHDQLQMYTTNDLLAHPLVSPVNHASLGGLCPLLVLVGGGEVLRDEQIYVAHKAANPHLFPANPVHSESKSEGDRRRDEEAVRKWGPTKVMLQVYDDCCHVTPTLSFTRPAKLMYRSIAHFSAWALARANKDPSIAIEQEDVSLSSKSTSPEAPSTPSHKNPTSTPLTMPDTSSSEEVDYVNTTPRSHMNHSSSLLPPFDTATHMIRQRISNTGDIYDLPPIPSILYNRTPTNNSQPATNNSVPYSYTSPLLHPLTSIGILTTEPIRRWLEGKKEWDTRYAREKRQAAARRARLHSQLLVAQFNDAGQDQVVDNEIPPPSALYGRTFHAFEEERAKRMDEKRRKEGTPGVGLGLWGWSKIGWGHDQNTVVKEKKDEIKLEKLEKKGARKAEKEEKKMKKQPSREGLDVELEQGEAHGSEE